MDIPIYWQYYTSKDLLHLARPEPLLICLQGGDNQNACCGGSAKENESYSPICEFPPHMVPSTGGIDQRTKFRRDKEAAEARKVRLTSGDLCKTLLDDTVAEPLPPKLRRPGDPKRHPRRAPKSREKSMPLPIRNLQYHESLEYYLSHLPFFGRCRYDRVGILKRVSKIKSLRGLLKYGRYYIEKDWKNRLDPRMDPDTLLTLQKRDEKKQKRLRSGGAVNRIVELFMDKLLGWSVSQDMLGQRSATRTSTIALLWLGPSLAKKMINELCVVKNPTKMFELSLTDSVDKDLFIINRLAVDVFFSDKEAFYCMLRDYVLSPTLVCKMRASETHHSGDGSTVNCQELEAKHLVTRRVCGHQNLSLSLKPCLVPNCPNFRKPVCEHLYVFIPETIVINSYISMLYFVERFERVEELKGCIFITKPAYLCNGRGINFFLDKKHFECFYHMLDGKATSRHGVVLQRYIECPRLFDRQKFTIRFFLLIIVLPKRRVIAFIHYGLAIFCTLPYRHVSREEFSPDEEAAEGKEPNLSVPIGCRTIGRVVDQRLNRYIHLSNYYAPKVRDKIKEDLRTGKAVMMEQDEDCVFYLEDVLPASCPNSSSIYIQMLFVAQCIMDYMQPVIQDYPGTFQTVSIDALVDARNKLWILEAGTKIFSGLLTIAPRQRYVMSTIIQESLGVTIECFFKSHKGLPLHWNYEKNCDDLDALYFAQDFNFFYETDITKQTDFFFHKSHRVHEKRLEQRYRQVDIARELVRKRKLVNEMRKKQIIEQRLVYIAKVKQKLEEES